MNAINNFAVPPNLNKFKMPSNFKQFKMPPGIKKISPNLCGKPPFPFLLMYINCALYAVCTLIVLLRMRGTVKQFSYTQLGIASAVACVIFCMITSVTMFECVTNQSIGIPLFLIFCLCFFSSFCFNCYEIGVSIKNGGLKKFFSF